MCSWPKLTKLLMQYRVIHDFSVKVIVLAMHGSSFSTTVRPFILVIACQRVLGRVKFQLFKNGWNSQSSYGKYLKKKKRQNCSFL